MSELSCRLQRAWRGGGGGPARALGATAVDDDRTTGTELVEEEVTPSDGYTAVIPSWEEQVEGGVSEGGARQGGNLTHGKASWSYSGDKL